MTDDKISKLLKLEPLGKEYLLERGWCCGMRCTNCPFEPNWVNGNKKIKEDVKNKKA